MAKNSQDLNDDVIQAAKGLFIFVLTLVAFLPGLFCFLLWKRPHIIRSINWRNRVLIAGVLLWVSFLSWYLWVDPRALYQPEFLYERVVGNLVYQKLLWIPLFWFVGLSAVILASPLILFFKKDERMKVRLKDFEGVKKRFYKNGKLRRRYKRALQQAFEDPFHVPIGLNLESGEIERLDWKTRCSHLGVFGTTGTGKSTLMMCMFLHAVRHNQPVIMIDPKGEMGSLEKLLKIAKKMDPEIEKRFRLFSMGVPERSATYNPLKNGTANEKKDRILEALNWSEQYYQSLSGSYLSTLLSAVEMTQTEITLEYLERISIHKPTQSELLKRLSELGKVGKTQADSLYRALEILFAKRGDDLLGLQAQISILNNPSIGHLFSRDNPENHIDLREVLDKNQIAYFQLNVLANGDTARRIGRMVIEDVKALTNYVYNTVTDESKRKFLPVFIDELGSFAVKEFTEFVKMARGAKVAIHSFTQGTEDLDAVSTVFRRQATSNPQTAISFRIGDDEGVNAIAALAGTMDALEQSHQVDGNWMTFRTGKGNQRETKQMRVEHDVLRHAPDLHGVIIRKSPSSVVGFRVPFPDDFVN